jgi:hypothetical protein
MTSVTLTYEIARAAATDAANRHMREACRTAWDEDDFQVACDTLDKLWFEPMGVLGK